MLLAFRKGLFQTGKFDQECRRLADKHYPRQKRGSKQFAPPGETLILRDPPGDVLFVWNRQLKERADHQQGLYCSIFRNETDRLSSDIILEAERAAIARWGGIRAFTYVDASKIKSVNPGFCFKQAGWVHVRGEDGKPFKSESGKYLLEKFLIKERSGIMLTLTQALSLVTAEREYQDKAYNPEEVLTSGQTRRTRDLDVTSHLVLLDIYVEKAKKDWNVKGDNRPALKQIAKIAAIAVRALERAGGSEVLLTEGLR